jgi:hypothetical protein
MPLFRFRRLLGDKLVLFIHIPKTGGASVERMLKDAGGRQALWSKARIPGACSFQHMHSEMLSACFPKGFCDLTFAVCRNPYDRIFSEYKSRVVEKGRSDNFEVWFDLASTEYSKSNFFADNHMRPQHEFVTGNCLVYKMEEDLVPALKSVTRRLGIRAPRRTVHHNRIDHSPVSIRTETQRRILSLYQRDFEVFGYDPDDFGRSFKTSD